MGLRAEGYQGLLTATTITLLPVPQQEGEWCDEDEVPWGE